VEQELEENAVALSHPCAESGQNLAFHPQCPRNCQWVARHCWQAHCWMCLRQVFTLGREGGCEKVGGAGHNGLADVDLRAK